ncbi:hypothetical protein JZ751_025609 [Albula glossodonta]|uniref:Uncharacterized protein n=1 Tax=Albula glossodonta TaxID=121402 RepID=A0A8T2NHX7_9TELE|nr:hypothetical protein JZ751_025609 [Albula glossodonta]
MYLIYPELHSASTDPRTLRGVEREGAREKERERRCIPVSSLTNSPGISGDSDHQQVQLPLQDAKMAARDKIRSRFHSSSDLIHRLFVCISGVADQLQTNYASDLRSILKTLFEVMATKPEAENQEKQKKVVADMLTGVCLAGDSTARGGQPTDEQSCQR